MRRYLVLLALIVLALPLMAPTCGDGDDDTGETPEATPEDVAKVVKTSMELAISSIDLAETIATIDNPPQFNPCMVATGSKAGLQIGISNIGSIEQEAATPDGKLHLNGGPVDFSRCMDMEGKPDPWPPTEPNPEVEAAIKAGVPAAVGIAKMMIEPKIPDEGQECIEGRVALAMMDSISEVVTTVVIDAVNGAPATQIPEFDVNYSGCGLDFSEGGDATPAP